MKFKPKTTQNMSSDTLICFIYENKKRNSELFCYLNKLSENNLEKQIEYGAISTKYGSISTYAVNKDIKAVIAGLGKFEELTRKRYYSLVISASKKARSITKNKTIGLELIEHKDDTKEKSFNKEDAIEIAVNGASAGIYEFNKYLTNKKQEIKTIEIIEENITPSMNRRAEIGANSSMAATFAKDLINDSAQTVTPEYIANIAAKISKEYNLECNIFDKSKIKKLGMSAFLAVGQGSVNEPKFIHLVYKPKNPRKKVALIGKGITFDAGGMDIKPAQSMLTMKSDMSGAASVLGVIQAISKLNSDVELHTICALCENMTSGSAYKPGDVVTAMNGKTIEVENTDAEGRITLADALCYCDLLNTDEVIDIATLTGAVIPALGHTITAVLGNNQKQINNFIEVAKKSCETVWQMPILDEFKDNLKSEIADFKNTGGRAAGTGVAGWFLSNFTNSENWLHLDIAGTAYLESPKDSIQGATGVMIKSLINYILS